MIWSRLHRLALFLSPRTASRSIARAVLGLRGWQQLGDHHGGIPDLPAWAREKWGARRDPAAWLLATVVRNHFSLLVSERRASMAFWGSDSRLVTVAWLEDWLLRQTTHYPRIQEGRLFRFLPELQAEEGELRILRFERLEHDLKSLFEELPMKPQCPRLPHEGWSSEWADDYRPFYDAESRSWVEWHFADELDLLGYSFDGGEP